MKPLEYLGVAWRFLLWATIAIITNALIYTLWPFLFIGGGLWAIGEAIWEAFQSAEARRMSSAKRKRDCQDEEGPYDQFYRGKDTE